MIKRKGGRVGGQLSAERGKERESRGARRADPAEERRGEAQRPSPPGGGVRTGALLLPAPWASGRPARAAPSPPAALSLSLRPPAWLRPPLASRPARAAPRALSPACARATMAVLMARVESILDKLTLPEKKVFKLYVKSFSPEPRITTQDLEAASTTSGLADLLLKRFTMSGISGVLTEGLKKIGRMDLVAESESLPRTSLKRAYENDGPELECYNMDQSRKAFVMCVKKDRPGAEKDLKLITNWLEKCKFEYTSCIDPNEAELTKELKQFRDGINGIKDGISCCLVTLMAHGGEGFIKTKLNERVNLSDIFEMFNNENCPALQEKPKIFVIQACRGDRRDGGVVLTDDEPMELDYLEKKRLPTFSDYYIIYPTQKGMQ
uniref:Caspase family p20 domain-containing protein n=2 Tax=Sarcophilus harrisii TaxID=9305 RepID=A0A7N4P2E1_SARHA